MDLNLTCLSEKELMSFVFDHIDHTRCETVGHCIFNAKLTETILRNSSGIKLTCKAKTLFAHSISSIAEEIVEDVLYRTSYITTFELQQACHNLEIPFSASNSTRTLPIQRLLNKYRSFCKFTITNDAKASLKIILHTIMRNCASQIHTHRTNKQKKTTDEDDIARVTDWIVVVRNYATRNTLTREQYMQRDGVVNQTVVSRALRVQNKV
jgi:histone H3/H4